MRNLITLVVGITAGIVGLLGIPSQVFALAPGDVQIEVNKTSVENDDLVRLGSSTLCRARVTGNPANDVTVVLTRTDTSLTFTPAGAQTLTLTLAKNGTWSNDFTINGVVGSLNKDDVKIEAHKDTATGAVLGDEDLSVFWFRDSNVTVAVGGYFGFKPVSDTKTDYTVVTGNGHAVDFAAWTYIEPADLDFNTPQLTNLRVNLVQNAEMNIAGTPVFSVNEIAWDTPTDFQWLTNISPLTVRTYQVLTMTGVYDHGRYLDTVPQEVPIYPDLGPNPIEVRPFPLLGGGTARSWDRPDMPGIINANEYEIESSSTVVAKITYTRIHRASRAMAFRLWAVARDISTKEIIPLKETTWYENIDSANTSVPQKAVPGTPSGGTSVTVPPELGGTLANNNQPEYNPSFSGIYTDYTR